MALVALVAMLVAAPRVGAEPDSSPPAAAGAAAEVPGHADGGGPSTDAPGHAGDAPGSSATAPGQVEPNGSSAAAPGQAEDGPGNSANAPGHARDDGPNGDVDQGAAIGQAADATASAGQEHVGNTHVDVRVDEPGNGEAVGQENRAEAAADASTSTVVAGTGEAETDQSVHAGADASQTDVSNTLVTVRVGSPGDDAGVTQTNAAAASAATGSNETASSVESAEASASQQGATNTSVSVRVFSPGDDGPVGQSNEAAAAAQTGAAGTGAALAEQEAVRNTSVSIRVASPGAAAEVVQANETTPSVTPSSDGSAGNVAVGVSEDALNTVVAVAVGATELDRPGAALQVWVWEWVWERDESEGLESVVPSDVSSWTWTWNGKGNGHGIVTSRAAGDDDRDRSGGTWEWNWEWDRGGVTGWTWAWDWHESLECASCVWIWNWSWSWAGAPPATGSAGTAGAPEAPTGQLNAARAEAEAAVTALVDQAATQDGAGAGVQYAGQLIQVDQLAEAVADARQDDLVSVTRGRGPRVRANVVESVAAAVLDAMIVQAASQLLVTGDGAVADQWSGQEVELVQRGAADARAAQHDATLAGTGGLHAAGLASADGTIAVEQLVAQGGHADGGSLAQWAGQLAIVDQAAEATSTVDQAGTSFSRSRGGTALAKATAGGLAIVEQTSEQAAARIAGAGSQAATQLAFVGQEAIGHATTAQQAGAAAQAIASSDAAAANRAAVLQAATQRAVGSTGTDIQDLVQQSIVLQRAVAVSTSNGGIGGSAAVVNCAVVQQGAGQSLAAGAVPVAQDDRTAFCLQEPAAPVTAPSAGDPAAPGAAHGPVDAADAVPAVAAVPTTEDEPRLFTGGRRPAAVPGSATPGAPRGTAPSAPRGRPESRPATGTPTKSSDPPSTQARLDTRPGSIAGAGDAGREPPLPPAGDPPIWVSALAAAASGAGPSGIAAILLGLALVAPFLLRAQEGSAVRRPTGVLVPIDVPV